MYNAKKPTGKKTIQSIGKGGKSSGSSAVPEAYYSRINSKRAVTVHHPIWEALNDVLVVKGDRVFVKER